MTYKPLYTHLNEPDVRVLIGSIKHDLLIAVLTQQGTMWSSFKNLNIEISPVDMGVWIYGTEQREDGSCQVDMTRDVHLTFEHLQDPLLWALMYELNEMFAEVVA